MLFDVFTFLVLFCSQYLYINDFAPSRGDSKDGVFYCFCYNFKG